VAIIGGYINAHETIRAAAQRRISVPDHLEQLWNVQGSCSWVIDRFIQHGAVNSSTQNVCEVGTGAALFAQPLLARYPGLHYESYELDRDWSRWLSETYPIVSHATPGDRLSSTADASIDFVHANGVFVYTPFLVTIKYFSEMMRVTRPGGSVAFDAYTEPCLSGKFLAIWLKSGDHYPCILPQSFVRQIFQAYGCRLVAEFFRKSDVDQSHYFVIQKAS
jgi:hypothetical protein